MNRRFLIAIILLALSAAALFLMCLYFGAVDIPVSAVTDILRGEDVGKSSWTFIILQSRLPMALTAVLAGAALSVAGLVMQTTFGNPLAGPSILGVSSGASLGVALVMLAAAPAAYGVGAFSSQALVLGGAFLGAALIILLLVAFSALIKGSLALIIVGIMISYLTSAVISLLNFFAPADDVKTFMVWGLGSFGTVTMERIPWFAGAAGIILLLSMLLSKPLNALLLGERYAANLGYNIRRTRTLLLAASGLLTALVTAFCGPIGFIGLIVPHIARMALRTSDHARLLPASMLGGAAVALFCTWISVVPSQAGVVPINAVTPVIGVPVILFILLARKRLPYFS